MRKKRMLLLFSLITLLALILHAYWLTLLGRLLIIADPLEPADAIVPLGGEAAQERLEHAASLFKVGYAQSFIIVNPEIKQPGIRREYNDLAKTEAIWQGVPEENIVFAPGIVTSTVDEALSVRQLASASGFRSLIVVTSPFHTRRTRRIFGEAFRETGITLTVQPVVGHWYKADSWWKSQKGLQATSLEYLKFLLYFGGYR